MHPSTEKRGLKRQVWWIVIVALALAATASTYLVVRAYQGDAQLNVVNPKLRGSLPPPRQTWPPLAGIEGIAPKFPSVSTMQGEVSMLVATCIDCRSGDVIGGFLGRLAPGDIPDAISVHVIAWDGNVDQWSSRSRINLKQTTIHSVTDEASAIKVQRTLGIGSRSGQEASGAIMLFDTSAVWRSTFAIGQLSRDDIRHDLEQLASE